jgi:tRNA 2-thiouridine synthesizing protein E
MNTVRFNDKAYEVDADGFLLHFEDWEENFAKAVAPRLKISAGLTNEHWDVIEYIRTVFEKEGLCPLIYQTCRENKLSIKDLERLFPTGYLRGACLLAGITYREGFAGHSLLDEETGKTTPSPLDKVYQVTALGFLINAYDWDEQFAICKAHEMKMPAMTEDHWQIIHFLRRFYKTNYRVPTIYETCESTGLEIEDMEHLFPDGYHRGAVKVAGLRVR